MVNEIINKEVYLYFEWVLQAKKIFMKQFFQQKTLELLNDTLKYSLTFADASNYKSIDFYRMKIMENLAYIYADVYLYQSGK